MSRSLPTTTKAISYWCGFSTIETMGSLQLVPKTPTTRKAETDSNQSTTIHERIPYSYRPTRFDVIERELVHSFIRS